MVHACGTPGCGTRTMGEFCLACEQERGIEFPRFVWQTVPPVATGAGDASNSSHPTAIVAPRTQG